MDFKFCSIHPKVSGGAIPGLKMLRSGFLMNRAQPAPLEMIFAMASRYMRFSSRMDLESASHCTRRLHKQSSQLLYTDYTSCRLHFQLGKGKKRAWLAEICKSCPSFYMRGGSDAQSVASSSSQASTMAAISAFVARSECTPRADADGAAIACRKGFCPFFRQHGLLMPRAGERIQSIAIGDCHSPYMSGIPAKEGDVQPLVQPLHRGCDGASQNGDALCHGIPSQRGQPGRSSPKRSNILLTNCCSMSEMDWGAP